VDSASLTASAAQSYGAVGWRCFPLVPGDKRPLFRGWQSDATTDPALLARWFADESRNIGVVCGESFDVFDIEAAHLPALVAMMTAGGLSLALTPVADTGRGGRHILTRPTGVGQNRLYLDGVHIGELKSIGGFIVVPPSVTEQRYRWRFRPTDMAMA
jgi:Bifunctional DNA primase/polymerase, N-terminal